MGEDLLPIVVALMQWGDRYLQEEEGPLKVLAPAGSEVRVSITDPDGTVMSMRDLSVSRALPPLDQVGYALAPQ
jgi:hypothetical protein